MDLIELARTLPPIAYGTLTERYVMIARELCPYAIRDAIKALPGFLKVADDYRGKMEEFPDMKASPLTFYFIGSEITLAELRAEINKLMIAYGKGE